MTAAGSEGEGVLPGKCRARRDGNAPLREPRTRSRGDEERGVPTLLQGADRQLAQPTYPVQLKDEADTFLVALERHVHLRRPRRRRVAIDGLLGMARVLAAVTEGIEIPHGNDGNILGDIRRRRRG